MRPLRQAVHLIDAGKRNRWKLFKHVPESRRTFSGDDGFWRDQECIQLARPHVLENLLALLRSLVLVQTADLEESGGPLDLTTE